jgi:hypothetical protein
VHCGPLAFTLGERSDRGASMKIQFEIEESNKVTYDAAS